MRWRTAFSVLFLSFSSLTANDEYNFQECTISDEDSFQDEYDDGFDSFAYSEGNDLPDGWEDDTFLEDGFEGGLFADDEEARSLHFEDAPIPDLPVIEAIPDIMVAGCVNALSGDFVESVSDLTVPGPLPLNLQRSWTSGERKWHFSHMPKLEIGFSKNGNHVEAGYSDDLGSGYHFKGPLKFAAEDLAEPRKGLRISSKSIRKGLTNVGSSEISGQTSWKGSSIRALRNKDKRRLILRHGTHIDRLFTRYSSKGTLHAVRCGKFHLEEEIHPSGNRFSYRYNRKDDLTHIVAKNKNQVPKHITSIKDVKATRSQIWTTPAGEVCYRFCHDRKKLLSVTSSQHALICYSYDARGRICEKRLPNGRILHIEYIDQGDNKDKVKRLKLSSGPQGTLETTHTFTYYGDDEEGQTTVRDAGGGITHYVRKNRRLDRICRPSGLIEEFTWNEDGELIKRTLISDGNTLLQKSLAYDPSGNITATVTTGDLKGDGTSSCYTKTFMTSQDSWHLPVEETDGELTIRFEYFPATNLLAKRFTYAQGILAKREFFTYDDNGCVASEILDDGKAENPDDLSGITERHVKKIKSTNSFPFGLPEKVEEFVYDVESGRLLPVSTVVTRYSPKGHKLEEKHFDSQGNHAYTLYWEYDSFGNLTLEKNALGETIRYSYDDNLNKILEEHATHAKYFTWDYLNRLIEEKEVWNDGKTLFQHHHYDVLGRKVKSIDTFGNETDYTYDTSGRLVETIHPKIQGIRPLEKAEYNALGYKTTTIDPRESKTQTLYTSRGQPSQIIYPDASVEAKEYNLQGRLVKEISKEGVTTLYARDPFGRVIKKSIYDRTGQLAKTTTCRYNTFRLLEETDEEGVTTLYRYDAAGRKISEQKGELKTEFTYDNLGRNSKKIEWISHEKARVTRFSYDLLERVIEEVIEELSGETFQRRAFAYDSLGNKTEKTLGDSTAKTCYNPQGRPVSKTDPSGFETRYFYDYSFPFDGSLVLKITRVDPLGNREITLLGSEDRTLQRTIQDLLGNTLKEETNYYDPSGRLVRAVSLNGVETHWEYDSMGRETVCKEAAALSGEKVTRHFYNNLGQKSATIKPDGVKLHFSYDALGRLEHETSSDGALNLSYTYDIKDRIVSAKNQLTGKETLRSYDHHGNLISETLENGLTINYSYDALNRLLGITLPDGSQVRYQRSGCRLVSVDRIISNESAYSHRYISHDLSGLSLTEELPFNMGTLQKQYDACHRLQALQAPSYQEKLSYDAVGNLIRRETQEGDRSLTNLFSYDPLYRLTLETGEFSKNYRYDSSDNRIEKNSDSSTVNALNQTLLEEGVHYRYDLNGNMVEKQDLSGTTTYRYDPLNRLTAIEGPSFQAFYSYDAFHRRIEKILNGSTEHYLYLQDNEIATYQNGSLHELRILGEGIAEDVGSSVAFEIEGKTLIPLHNSSGSVALLLDQKGDLNASCRTTAFGESDIKEPVQPWIFSSKRFDPESGFYNFGRRYYSPSLGRFITPDPLGFEDGLNLYAYVHNNPLIHIDPDGQLAFLIPIAINIGVCYALEAALPYAVTALEAYGATTAASFVSGTVHGFTGEFEWSALGLGSELSYAERAGVTIGFARSWVGGGKLVDAVKNVASNEMVKNIGAQLTSKATQVTSWYTTRTARTVAQETTAKTVQKTTKIAVEKKIANKYIDNLFCKTDDVIHVTPQGVAIPPGLKYKIPTEYTDNLKRPGSYGIYDNGKFIEKLRIDPPTKPGMKGPNFSHYHLNNKQTHYAPRPNMQNPGFNL